MGQLQRLQTGAGVRIIGNGITIGFCTNLSFTRQQNVKVINEIDNPYPRELAPTTYMVSGNLAGFRAANMGGLDGATLMNISTVRDFFYQKYVQLQVVDRVSDKVIYTIQNVMFDSDSWNIGTKSVITFSASFKGTFISSEVSTVF